MTEDEAKTKWCPMVRRPGWADTAKPALFVGNLPEHGHEYFDGGCIGSACMMFRHATIERVDFNSNNVVTTRNELTYYCGLAGKL